jgi:acetyl esterase/lipase
MKFKKPLKRILTGLLAVLSILFLFMITPRLLSVVFPKKPPVGYHLVALDYLALKIGLEDTISKHPPVPATIDEFKNIEYKNINGKSLQLDLYRLKDLYFPAPLLIFIHGGGWKGGQRSDYLPYLLAFAQKGYVTATVSYRLLNDGPYPACAEDITDAIKWFFRNAGAFGYDPDRIAVIGGSAGSHLAMLAGYGWMNKTEAGDSTGISQTGQRIKAIVEIYGPTDLTTEYARNHPLVTSFLAHSYAEAPELYKDASPVTYLDKNDPPTLILHGTSDNLVPVSQAKLLKHRLDSLGVPAVLCTMPLWPHTMDIVKRVNDYSQVMMLEFFDKYLK